MLLILILLFSFAFSDIQDLIDTYCGGSVPCYLCTDGKQIKACFQRELCPLEKVKCKPECPPGGTYNAQTGKCEAPPG